MKNRITKIIVFVFVIGMIGGAGYWFLQKGDSVDSGEIAAVVEKIEQRQEDSEKEAETGAKSDDEKPEVVMSEEKVQIYLHQMTHQKIIADKKRGAVEMSPENIKNMLKIIKANYDIYEHSEFYERTLTAWEQGDFSNAVNVHNTIWNWHKGTVGRATGLMSPEQEAEYVEKHFR